MLVNRERYLNKLIRYKDKDLIKVITGVRRCGKSVLLFDIFFQYLVNNGVESNHIIRVNLENMESIGLRNAETLHKHIVDQKVDDEKYYVMIDEIQYVEDFEDLVNSLKNNNFDVYITGSNSKMLSGDISTALRGRSIEIKVYPLSFAEYYEYVGGDARKAFDNYMVYGGFPYSVTEAGESLKTEYLKMLESTVATKNIVERYNIKNKELFSAVYDFLSSNIGVIVSAKKITDTLKSSGNKTVTSDTVGKYLEYLCEAFLFYKVYRYDIKGKEYLKTLNKYYCVDVGLRNAHMNYRQVEVTHILENIIYLELLRRGCTVDIGKNREKEIDFVARNGSDTYYIQVAYSLIDEDKKKQELGSFKNIDDGYKKIVITMDDDPFNVLENGYKKINAIEFLLDEEALERV